ncbi:MAG TPA: NigD-like C-terminal domain-containing protein [Bacteroidales bacterium]|jgi:hypothetical protein|nr:NigD-like C-terminal domain-containing protein [Bacteroidales bacterium]
MKRVRIFYFLVIFSLIFGACSKDEGPQYYSVLGTVEKANDSTFVISDEDEKLLVNNSSALNLIKDNERIIAYFSISDMAKPAGVDLVIDIYNYSEVLFKPVTVLTEEIADSIGNDPMNVRDIWLAKDYLNLNFEYYGGSTDKIHYINLIRYPGDIPTDTVELEIRHNDNEDSQTYYLSGFVSFDLQSLRHAGDSVVLHIKAKDYDLHQYEKYFTYRF